MNLETIIKPEKFKENNIYSLINNIDEMKEVVIRLESLIVHDINSHFNTINLALNDVKIESIPYELKSNFYLIEEEANSIRKYIKKTFKEKSVHSVRDRIDRLILNGSYDFFLEIQKLFLLRERTVFAVDKRYNKIEKNLRTIQDKLALMAGLSMKIFQNSEYNKLNFEIVTRNSLTCIKLCDNAYVMKQLHVDKKKIDLMKIPLVSIIDEIVFDYELHTKARNIKIKKGNFENLFVNANEKLLSAAYGNLLGNAIKYSAKDKYVEISAKLDHSKVKVSFSNFGPHEIEKERIFQDKVYRSEYLKDSTGLGNIIVSRAFKAMDGSISVLYSDSNGPTIIETSLNGGSYSV